MGLILSVILKVSTTAKNLACVLTFKIHKQLKIKVMINTLDLEEKFAENLTTAEWKQIAMLPNGGKIISEKIKVFLQGIEPLHGSTSGQIKKKFEEEFKKLTYPVKSFSSLNIEINHGQVYFKGSILAPVDKPVIEFSN